MKLPRKAWINGYEVSIESRSLLMEDKLGQFNAVRQEVAIHDKLAPALARATLLHELIHAMIAYDTIVTGDREGEKLTASLETAFFSFLSDPRNKPVIRYILGWE